MTNEIRSANRTRYAKGRIIVILIGIFKLGKGFLMILTAVTAIALSKPDFNQRFQEWVAAMSIGPHRRRIGDFVLTHILGLQDNLYKAIAVGAALYATMFFTEGMGLLFNKTWAEWMVVVTSAGLIPFELGEIYRRPGLVAVIVFILNVAIVVYLYLHVRNEMKQHGSATTPSGTPPAPLHPDAGSCEPGTSSPRSEASASAHP
jgi:hypothetical protein